MEIELEKSRNDLLHRTNVLAKIRAVKTPSRKEIIKKVSAMLGADETLVVIDKIVQSFGEKISTAYVKVYDNSKYLKEIELEYKIKRTIGTEEKKEDVNEDIKTEDKKENIKTNEKKEVKEKHKEDIKTEDKKEVKEKSKKDAKEESSKEATVEKKE